MESDDWFSNGFGAAIADIRQKLVEEPWFGQAVTPPAEATQPGLAEGLGWAQSPEDRPAETPEKSPGKGHGIDIER